MDARISSDEILNDLRTELIGQKCCRLDIRSDKSMFAGFGEKYIPVQRHLKCCVEFYGFWELGTYASPWRIHKDRQFFITSETLGEDIAEVTKDITLVDTKLIDIQMLSEFDVRFKFSTGISLDFLGGFVEDDETLHVLRISAIWWKLKNGVWSKGQSRYTRDFIRYPS